MLLRALYSRSSFLVRQHRVEDAKLVLREMLAIVSTAEYSNPRKTAAARYSLVSLLTEPGEAEEALELLFAISELLSDHPHLQYPPRRGVEYYTGRALLMLGRHEEAERRLNQAMELQVAELGSEHTVVAATRSSASVAATSSLLMVTKIVLASSNCSSLALS